MHTQGVQEVRTIKWRDNLGPSTRGRRRPVVTITTEDIYNISISKLF